MQQTSPQYSNTAKESHFDEDLKEDEQEKEERIYERKGERKEDLKGGAVVCDDGTPLAVHCRLETGGE